MTAVQMNALNAQIWRDMGTIAEDDGMMRRVAKYLRKVVKEMTADPTEMTKEEFFRRVDEAREQIRRGEGHEMLPNENLTEYLQRRGYDI